MTELLTAAQMRAIEQAVIDSGEVTGLELMERAGQGVVDAIFAEWPELRRVGETHRAVVLCGPGNNGGDGFVVARLLKEAGWEVEVFLYGDAEKLPPDAKVNYERWQELGKVLPHRVGLEVLGPPDPALVIDAVFGTGLSRPPEGLGTWFLSLAEEVAGHHLRSRLVSIDLPSGVCSDSGRQLISNSFAGLPSTAAYPTACAHLTVTFHSFKQGHFLSQGPQHCGQIHVVDLGLPEISRSNRGVFATRPQAWGDWPQLDKKEAHHKYSHGHAFILSGGVGKGGAARLAARGALRIGAGAVTLGTPPAALIENAAQLNAIMLTAIKDADTLTETLQDKRINALCLGPGMGTGERQAALVAGVLAGEEPRPTVLDADALTILANDKTLFGKLHKNCILTPHAGEFARLFPNIAETLNAPATKGPAYSKVDATRDAAKRAGCVVLFKGPDTVIADPSGRCSINASVYERSAPWLATAGSGDVLAGFITGLLARGFQPMQAAETGAWLHTECALSFGPGLIAEDIPEELPKVFRKLGL